MRADTTIRVRYAETDQMGVVYHANYFPWFEEARTDLLLAIGYSYREMEEQGYLFPLVECSCRYRQPARYMDVLTVRSGLTEMKGAKFTIGYHVYRISDGAMLAEGTTTHVFVDKQLRPVNMRRLRPDVYDAMLQSMEREDGDA